MRARVQRIPMIEFKAGARRAREFIGLFDVFWKQKGRALPTRATHVQRPTRYQFPEGTARIRNRGWSGGRAEDRVPVYIQSNPDDCQSAIRPGLPSRRENRLGFTVERNARTCFCSPAPAAAAAAAAVAIHGAVNPNCIIKI